MSERRRMYVTHFLQFVAAFAVSVYAVSSLMPMFLHATLNGLNLAEGMSIIVYLLAVFISTRILAQIIYTLDRKAGRIRNKIGWFE